MTTNIFDSSGHLMATDSRWSITFGHWLIYLDDVSYDKIERHNGKVLMFAGFGRVIQQWKDWIRSNPSSTSGMPAHKGMSVCMVDAASRAVEFVAKQEIVANGVYCAGSGALPAYSCWMSNRDARRAVETAKSMDFCSGGEVKFVDFKNGAHNLNYPTVNVTIDMVDAAISQRGLVMKMDIHSHPTSTPFAKSKTACANDSAPDAPMDEIRAKIAAGELSATAPCSGMHNDWSDGDKEAFNKALGKMFNWSK